MKWVSIVIALLMGLASARAEGPDDQYVAIYNVIQEADGLNNISQFGRALAKYRDAQTSLARLQKVYPDWNPGVIKFRLNYVTKAIEALQAKEPPVAAPAPGAPVPQTPAAPGTTAAAPGKPAPPADWENRLSALGDQVQRLQEDKASLEAKLKEALAAQPGVVDPRELAKADERIKGLLKENELLQVSLDQARAKAAPGAEKRSLDEAQQALARANKDLAEQTRKANALEKEKQALEVKLKNLPPSSYNAAAIASTRKDLATANRDLAEQKKLASSLAKEKEEMQSRFKAMKAENEAAATLRSENEILKKQVARLKGSSPGAASPSQDEVAQLARAQAQIAQLEKSRKELQRDKEALQARLKQLAVAAPPQAKGEDADRMRKLEQERDDLKQQLEASRQELKAVLVAAPAAPAASPPPAAKGQETARLKKLEQERDALRKQLDAATKELNSRRGKATAAHVLELETQLASMRARIDVLEANQVPYTAEEAALFRVPESKPVATSKAAAKASKELPPGTVALYAEAKRYYTAKQLDKAEDRYLQVLQQDQHHVPTLANLAAVELELNHLPQAETNIQQALALAPEEPACLALLGELRFRQSRYDAAMDALSRAAKADPRNAEVQNYLGLTLSAKGLRGAAETALRKAIQLEPRYGDAHNNLAVIYATQKPPLLELARWHYQKALDTGSKPNPNLEKILEPQKVTDSGK